VALLLPSALLTWRPLPTLGLSASTLPHVPTATFPAVAQMLERALQMGYIGSGLLLLGAFGTFGVLGARRGDPCPSCGRDRHPSWKGTCPECRLMEPGIAESPLMRVGDLSASGMVVTQFTPAAQTELLDAPGYESAWVTIERAPSGVGERFSVGARLSIGRDPSQCRLVLDDEAVSAQHAYIERDHHSFAIYDWDSRNGIQINGERVSRRELHDGDLITIGRAQLRYAAPPVPSDSAPTMLLESAQAGARLVLLDDSEVSRIFAIRRLDVRIGRGRQNDLILDSPTVSRHHASVRFDGCDYYLVDAGTSNGTWLDGARVIDRARLRPNQEIRMGDQRLRFELEGPADVEHN
jgi:pSer/pThr/pTyr-binding forkhead associated (FHA) protein